ncbi:conserved membrane protein of unknown function [Modestobacter italicus]|uniref:Uncharacterized protein n=1 Tax=Modestobacter italicus (strain DSM 44449 / CECT 9708 / BC 501) TaxID=2732864 RepID=I4ERC4_MODI5|nr:hypothetical protein [Modestobacter marinus]CCH85937.1 conserved membrane protein of unknown function [Modestobacter marinus]
MTTLTLVTLAVVLYGALSGRGYGRALALGGATPIGAAVVFGDTAVPTFYFVALGAAAGLALGLLIRSRRFQSLDAPRIPGVAALVLLTLWAVLITLAAPLLFDGLSVLAPGGGESRLSAGVLSSSNVAQIVYLVLGVCVVVFLARSPRTVPQIIGTAAGLATMLSFWAYLHATFGVPYPLGFFDNSPAFVFIETAPGNVQRFRGIFSEPAGLATSSLVTAAYMFSRAPQVRALRRLGVLLVAAIALYLAVISTSGTFLVAGLALLLLSVVVFLSRFVLKRGPLNPLSVTTACAAVIASLWLLPIVAAAIERGVSEKVASSSYSDRSGADTASYELLFRTFGLGVGLGSNRPSSFLAALLSTLGIVGTVLFAIAVGTLIRQGYGVRAFRPVVWALTALLISKFVSGPDLADTSGILWMSLGVLAHAAVTRRAGGSATGSRAGQVAVWPARTV